MTTEFKRRMVPYEISKRCECGGELRATDMGMEFAFGSSFEHACTDCGDNANFPERYPKIEFEPYLD